MISSALCLQLYHHQKAPDGTTDQNVFDITEGVSIVIFIKRQSAEKTPVKVFHKHLYGVREVWTENVNGEKELTGGKYQWLSNNDKTTTDWKEINPNTPHYLFIPMDETLREEYQSFWKIIEMMSENSLGCLTKRDNLVIDFTKDELQKKIAKFIDKKKSDLEATKEFGLALQDKDMWKAQIARSSVSENEISSFIRKESYRPFDDRFIFYHEKFIARLNRRIMSHLEKKNLAMIFVRQLASLPFYHVWTTNQLADQHLISVRTKEGGVVFPLYLYPTKQLCTGSAEVLRIERK